MLIGYMQSKTSLEMRQPQALAGPVKRWLMRVWNWLVEAGEARVRARVKRGIYHF